ncbi:MAG TPA: IPT/TIG domain-containing protein [Candidatus Manganitrophaceae bacterium]|nr:IPT/TIG domain-containing protein [Candidatus Manganitrophaceae bacterium]
MLNKNVLIGLGWAFFLVACSGGEGMNGGDREDQATVPVTVRVGHAAPHRSGSEKALLGPVPSGVMSVSITVTDSNSVALGSAVLNVTTAGDASTTLNIPAGANRLFSATAYDAMNGAGAVLYQGSATANLIAGQPATVTIAMTASASSFTLSVTLLGSGTVVSNSAGISCPTTCSAFYANGATVTLTATPDSGSTFSGWSGGGCAGSGSCTVTLSADTAIAATFTLRPPALQITRLSLTQGIIRDTLKVTGSGFGATQGTSAVTIGGVDSKPILRWNDTEIAAIIPSGVTVSNTGTSNSVVVTVGGQPSNLASLILFDHTHGVGGELDDGNLDKFVLNPATASVTLEDVPPTFGTSGETSSVVLSGDGNTVAEADHSGYGYGERIRSFDTSSPVVDEPLSMNTQDAAISRDGTVALLTNGSPTLTLLTGFNSTVVTQNSIPNPVDPFGNCFYEVALSSDGNTAAVIGQENPNGCIGAFHLYRLDGVLSGSPAFTDVSTAGINVSYTDVAISEDGKTVIVGEINGDGSAGIERVADFNTASPVVQSDQSALVTGCLSVNTVDVDLSADGMTGIAGVAGCSLFSGVVHNVFQLLNADLSSAVSVSVATPSSLEGVAVNSGGSIALVKTGSIDLNRLDGFNQPNPTSTALSNVPNLNTGAGRNQDQIDLQ